MNSLLNETLSLAFICLVKMKERTKGPQDTVHLSLAASGAGLAAPSLGPWKARSAHQGASAAAHSEQGKDGARPGRDLLWALCLFLPNQTNTRIRPLACSICADENFGD